MSSLFIFDFSKLSGNTEYSSSPPQISLLMSSWLIITLSAQALEALTKATKAVVIKSFFLISQFL